jgi:transcriptional regulator with XRE-family HTH domain
MMIRFKDIQEFQRLLIVGGFTHRGFAREILISSPYMTQLATGKRNPSPKVAKKICGGLGVDFDDIFCIEEDNKSYQNKSA